MSATDRAMDRARVWSYYGIDLEYLDDAESAKVLIENARAVAAEQGSGD